MDLLHHCYRSRSVTSITIVSRRDEVVAEKSSACRKRRCCNRGLSVGAEGTLEARVVGTGVNPL